MVQFEFPVTRHAENAFQFLGLVAGFFVGIAILLQCSDTVGHLGTPQSSEKRSSLDAADVHDGRVKTEIAIRGENGSLFK